MSNAPTRHRPPHPATVQAAGGKPPHPATIQTKSAPPHPAVAVRARPPHPATVQAKAAAAPHPATRGRDAGGTRPHPATAIAQRAQDDNAVGNEVIEEYCVAIRGDKNFREFIKSLLKTIEKVNVGKAMLKDFAGAANATEWDQKKVKVLVRQYAKIHASPLRTDHFGAFKADGKPDASVAALKKAVVPMITCLGPGMAADGLTVDGTTLKGHADFPGGTPMHAVLFHELCHSYLRQIGVAEFLAHGKSDKGLWQNSKATYVDRAECTEEQMVCGLWAGKGLSHSENAYRASADLPARTQYSADTVGIYDEDLAQAVKGNKWPAIWSEYASTTDDVLKANGFK